MLFNTKRRVVIFFFSILILLLYFSRSLSIIIPFSIAVIALFLFLYIDRAYKFEFPERFYVYIFLIFVLGTIIGPGDPPFGLYYRALYYDKLLHFFSPLMASAIVFFMLDRLKIDLKWKLLMTVGLVFGILGLFEIGEYLSDKLFNTLLQGVYSADFSSLVKERLVLNPWDDTMQDLIFGLIGSLVFVVYIPLRKWLLKF